MSSLGAGDSFVAGFVCALDAGATLEAAFRRGVAAGSAALPTPGTDLCSAADTDRLTPLVTITALCAGVTADLDQR
ncbi:MAG: PfkB family carbohydrate kinase [Hyphomonadaceae bacterium]